MRFEWHPDQPPPNLEEHSKAKLAVLRDYLRAYFDRLGANPSRDEFKLDLIDGFAGGGTFLENGQTISGTPLIMLEESKQAIERLIRRRTKSLNFDFKYYFVDIEKSHTDHLRKVLAERGYGKDDEKIIIHNRPFEDVAEQIIASVRGRQPRAGRAIFLLDQCGFNRVALDRVAQIFGQLPTAEVILTFNAGTLITYLNTTPQMVQAVDPLGMPEQKIRDLLALRDGDGGKALVQRALRTHIRALTGATYDTPFFIRPKGSRRALWFLHLARHPIARDVMMKCHWNALNTFEHFGTGSFGMLGWDALKDGSLPLFTFEELDAAQMREQLLRSMPQELFTLTADETITVDAMHHRFANETAARFSDLDTTVLKLAHENEIEILDADGKMRSRRIRRLRPTDRIAMPRMPLLPGLSRRR